MTVRVKQCSHHDTGDVFVGRWRVAVRTHRHRQHPKLGGSRENLQIVVGEEAGINRDMGCGRQQLKQFVGQPVMAGHQRRMLGTGQPLAKCHHCLDAGAARRHGKGDRAFEGMWVVREVEEQPVHPIDRGLNLLNVKHIRDDSLSAQRAHAGTTRIVTMHQGPRRHASFQQLGRHRAADLACGARNEHTCLCHWSSFPSRTIKCDRWLHPEGMTRCDRCQHLVTCEIVMA
jgi:hypothetical protein